MRRTIHIALLCISFLLTSCVSVDQTVGILVVVHDHCADEISEAFTDSYNGFAHGYVSEECARDLLFAANHSLSDLEGDGQ